MSPTVVEGTFTVTKHDSVCKEEKEEGVGGEDTHPRSGPRSRSFTRNTQVSGRVVVTLLSGSQVPRRLPKVVPDDLTPVLSPSVFTQTERSLSSSPAVVSVEVLKGT